MNWTDEQEEKALKKREQQATEIIMAGIPNDVDPNKFIEAIKEPPVVKPKFLEEGD